MFNNYDELLNHVKNVFGETNIILNYIESAFELGLDEGETLGFRAMNEEYDNIDIDDLPGDLVDEIENGAYDRGVDDGYSNGYDEGRHSGYDEGHSDGHSSGYDEGYSNGYDECRVEMEE